MSNQADVDTDVERMWVEFWKPLVSDAGGIVDMTAVKRELYDYGNVMEQVSRVYDVLTNGRLSKPNTGADYVIDAANAAYERLRSEDERRERQARRPRIYIAGPYTHGDVVVNVQNAVDTAEDVLMADGLPYVPHLTHLWHLISPHEHAYWLALDLPWLRTCDAVYRLPGVSAGADQEVEEAQRCGIPVFETWEALSDFIESWFEGQVIA